MIYVFDGDVAKEYGVNCAVLIYNLQSLISKNRANGVHFYDGHYWTYNSLSAFEELFPFLSKKQIERMLNKLVDSGVIIKGDYNKIRFERTVWYAFNDEQFWVNGFPEKGKSDVPEKGKSDVPEKGKSECPKRTNLNDQIGRVIKNKYNKNKYYTPNDNEKDVLLSKDNNPLSYIIVTPRGGHPSKKAECFEKNEIVFPDDVEKATEQGNENMTPQENVCSSQSPKQQEMSPTGLRRGSRGGGGASATLEERTQLFMGSLAEFVEGNPNPRGVKQYRGEMVEAFFYYWSEPNQNHTKMRFEMEKTWETSRRLATWVRKDNEYNRRYGTEQDCIRREREEFLRRCEQYLGDDAPF